MFYSTFHGHLLPNFPDNFLVQFCLVAVRQGSGKYMSENVIIEDYISEWDGVSFYMTMI